MDHKNNCFLSVTYHSCISHQLFPGDTDSLIQAVKELRNTCDAVDIVDFTSSSNSCPTSEHDKWKAWLSSIKRVHHECATPVLCKLPFTLQTVNDTIRKGKLLEEAGCEVHVSPSKISISC